MAEREASKIASPESLQAMLRIMDVATTLRKERETVRQELDYEQARQHLRRRLLDAAEVTGERVTPEEVDAAIDQYYETLHAFRQPPRNLSLLLAHLYVRRGTIAKLVIPLLLAGALIWALWLAPFAPFSASARLQRQLAAAQSAISADHDAIQALARQPEALAELVRLTDEAEVYRKNKNVRALTDTRHSLNDLRSELEEEYTVYVVTGPEGRSGVERLFADEKGQRVSGHYLVLEARDKQGNVLPRKIRNHETDRDELVTRWTEFVSEEVKIAGGRWPAHLAAGSDYFMVTITSW